MAGVSITTNAEDVLMRFDLMLDLTKNFKPYFKKLVGTTDSVVDWTIRGTLKQTFGSQKGPNGEAWAPLSARYKKWKDKNYPGRDILELNGTLMNSLMKTNDYTVYSMESKKLSFGTTLPYAQALHYGYAPRNLTPRPFMGWRPGQKDKAMLALRLYLCNIYKKLQSSTEGE